MNSRKVFSIVGESQGGKTHLIRQLIPELRKRGLAVAVIKHCSHGFDLEPEGKDSWKFVEAGSDGVAMISSDRSVVMRKNHRDKDFLRIAGEYFYDMDMVLVEGGASDRSLKKIEVMRRGSREKLESSLDELIAVVSDSEIALDKPVFQSGQIKELADFLEKDLGSKESMVTLYLDGKSVPLNSFVQNIFENTTLGMVKSLKGIKEEVRRITLSIIKGRRPK